MADISHTPQLDTEDAAAPRAGAQTAEGHHTVCLKHVNAAPAQTWNWLNINESELCVDMPEELARAFHEDEKHGQSLNDELPEIARNIAMGAGKEVSTWIDLTATQHSTFVVGGDEPGSNGDDAPGSNEGNKLNPKRHNDTRQPQCIVVKVGQHNQTTVIVESHETADLYLVVDTTSNSAEGALHSAAAALRIVLKEQASLACSVVLLGSEHSPCVANVGALLKSDAHLSVKHYVLGGSATYAGMTITLEGDGALAHSEVRYIGQDHDALDITQNVRHHEKKTTSSIEATGVLHDEAHKVLRATIDLSRGCKGAEGAETETVLMAGDKVVNKTLPVILCSEDDVAGNHGATIGSLSEEQLFYLASHGIDTKTAHSLFSFAVISDAKNNLPADLATYVDTWADKHLTSHALDI